MYCSIVRERCSSRKLGWRGARPSGVGSLKGVGQQTTTNTNYKRGDRPEHVETNGVGYLGVFTPRRSEKLKFIIIQATVIAVSHRAATLDTASLPYDAAYTKIPNTIQVTPQISTYCPATFHGTGQAHWVVVR